MKIIHAQQPTHNTCASACLAMLTQRPIEQIIEEFHHEYQKGHTDELRYLLEKGYDITIPSVKDSFLIRSETICLACVPSLNIKGGMHCVVVDLRSDSAALYDPNYGRERVWSYTLDDTDEENRLFKLSNFVVMCEFNYQ